MPTFNPGATKEEIGLGNLENILNNYTATLAPTVTDDENAGYQAGSEWLDVSTGDKWVLVTATAGSAAWERVSVGGLIEGTSNTGVSEGGLVSKGSGPFDIDVSAGFGFISNSGYTTKIVWNAVTLEVDPNLGDYHVIVDVDGLVQVISTGAVDHETQLELAAFSSNATTVRNISSHQVKLSRHVNLSHEFIEEIFGTIWVSGATVAENGTTALRLDVDSGTYYVFDNKRTITGAAPASFTSWYRDGSGNWTNVMGATLVDTDYYDDGSGTLAAIPAGEFKKDLFLVSTDDGQDYFHLFYGQATFATQQDAETSTLLAVPASIEYGSLPLAALVSQQGGIAIAAILDARPRLGISTPGGAAAANHGDLSGLGANDHLQYQLRSEKGAASGYAGLGVTAKVPTAQLPYATATWNANQIQTVDVNNAAIADGKVLVYRSGTGDLEYENLPASDVAYSNTASGLAATTAQAAIDEVEGRVDTLETAPVAHAASHVTGGSDKIRNATAAQDGLMTLAYAGKLDNVAANANNYSHPNHSGDVTSVGDGAQTIALNAVTNAKLAQMVQSTVKGRAAGAGTGDPADLTKAQVLTLLNVEDGADATPSSTEVVQGKIEIATQAETNAGIDNVRAVTPLKLANYSQFQRVESLGLSTTTDTVNWTDKAVLTTPVLTGKYLLLTDFVSSNLDKLGEHQLWDATNSVELWRKDSRTKINEASTSASVSLVFAAQARVLKLRFRAIIPGLQEIRSASLTFFKTGI